MEAGALKTAVKEGLDSESYISLLTSLCSELKSAHSLQEEVTHPQGRGDAESLQLELRSFLLELKCPHLELTMDMMVLFSYEKRLLMMDYLVSEVMASRLVALQREGAELMEVNGKQVSQQMWKFQLAV